ncbi:hypothetical protein ACFSZS_20145 [Seohaeicola zhoushanensis]
MQFIGQTHLLRVPLDRPDVDTDTLQRLFEEAYFRRFRVELPEIRANLVNANCSVIGARPEIDLATLIAQEERKATVHEAQITRRPVFFHDWHETPVYWRDHLPADARLTGPAVIQQMDTTILIEPGDRVTTDAGGNLIVEVAR